MGIFDSFLKGNKEEPTENHTTKALEEGKSNIVYGIPRYIKPKKENYTFLLVENTIEVLRQKDKLEKIVKELVTDGFITVINYGSTIQKSKMINSKTFDCKKLFNSADIGSKVCIYDALDATTDSVNELETKMFQVGDVQIIGIGTCNDNCSKLSKKIAIRLFNDAIKRYNISTKYFCLTEKSFVKTAEIGFHSIGAICRSYVQK